MAATKAGSGTSHTWGREIANAVLDLAEYYSRLAPAARQAWNEWVSEAMAVISEYRGTADERPAFLRRLAALTERPIPPVSVNNQD